MPRFNPILEQLQTYPAVAIDQRKAELLAEGRTVFDFGKGDPEEPVLPAASEALKNAVAERMPYPRVKGSDAVRESIAAYMDRRFGVQLDPATQILPTSGSKEAVFHMPLMVIDRDAPDRAVVFPDPGYPAYHRGVLFAGGEPIAVRLEGDHILRPWTLPAEVIDRTRMIWLNSPHNPSGAVMSLDDLQQAADFCRERDILLVSDETYADVYHSDPPHSLLECGTEGVLVLHSLSKRSGMTGYRSGFLAGDRSLMAQLTTLRTNPGLVPTDFVNAAAVAAWSDDQHAVERRSVTRQKKQLFLDFFDGLGMTVIGREASLYLWVKVPDGDDEAYAERLLEAGIVVSPGRIFGVAGAGVGYIRLAMVPKLDVCKAAIKASRIGGCVEALKQRIEAFSAGGEADPDAVHEVIGLVDSGALRVAEKIDGEWVIHEWVRQAILLYFRVAQMAVHELGPYEFHDKIPLKTNLAEQGVRLVPPGFIRYGAHVERGAVVMPGYVNIGAHVGAGTMVDTWATVGSCAQIGKNVHLSGGVGIGGVLEPPGARPVIIEDGAFIGSRCIVVEGVHVGAEAVLGANVVLTASTPIVDVTGPEEVVTKGAVPPRSVVIPGIRPKKFPAGEYGTPCALIIGQRKESTDKKTSLNQVLREFAVAV